jgi:hypothetical protein
MFRGFRLFVASASPQQQQQFRGAVTRSRAMHTGRGAGAQSSQSARNALFAAVAGAAGASAGVWAFVSQREKSRFVAVDTVLAAEPVAPAPAAAVTAVTPSEFRVFRLRVLPLYYRLAVVALTFLSGGLLYPFVVPVLMFNHLEEAVPNMSVAGRKLEWRGKFTDFYTVAMKNLLLTVVTFGFYHLLGYADANMETFIDENIAIANGK